MSSQQQPQLTCISCRAGFRDLEAQRSHYKGDWHRYNLKRKVANFEPVSAEEFQSRVLLARQADQPQNTARHCKPCSKTFNTNNSYENHIHSKKHKLAELDFSPPSPSEGRDQEVKKLESDDDVTYIVLYIIQF